MTPESFVAVICTNVSFNRFLAHAVMENLDRMLSSAACFSLCAFWHKLGGLCEILI